MNEKQAHFIRDSFIRAFGLDGKAVLGCASPMALEKKNDREATFLRELIKSLGRGDLKAGEEVSAAYSGEAAIAYRKAVEDLCPSCEILEKREGESGKQAMEIARLWTPEIACAKETAVKRWRLASMEKHSDPIRPDEVLLELNGLYTLPEHLPEGYPSPLLQRAGEVLREPGESLADYDHPVPLFADDDEHELIACLKALDRDIAFEIEQGVFPADYRVPVLLSISVSHPSIDGLCSDWIRFLLERKAFRHLRLFLLNEAACRQLDQVIFGGEAPQFSVIGAYGRHFSALKYSGLLFERAFGIRASFKLDTDEEIASRRLHQETGRTWFQTLCHPFWGASAVDHRGKQVRLGVNEGEYMDSRDIDRLGYRMALRCPDVHPPASAVGRDLFFQKGYAHGRATAWYNEFDRLEDAISHPVVKGGGYGIDNDSLRRAIPFTWSRVGRAEDQQFYFMAMAGGVRGIFHPDLRIVHNKSSVSGSEQKTEASRIAGDMYRLVQFQFLVERLQLKEELDPMPGVFAGTQARAQAFFHLIHRAVDFCLRGEQEKAVYLLGVGLSRLAELEELIDSGEAGKEIERESRQWTCFVDLVDSADQGLVGEELYRLLTMGE